jgi:hypothetical protein
MSSKRLIVYVVSLMLLSMGFWQAVAQDATEEPPAEVTPEPSDEPTPLILSVTSSEPQRITRGEEGVLSIFGANFTTNTTVRLVGFGLLEATFVNSGALRAKVPNTVSANEYEVEVSDPIGGTTRSPNTLRVVAPPATQPPEPTAQPTLEPPTAVPGTPSLLVRNYSSNPSSVAPGGSVVLTLEIVNQGNRTAQGGSVAVESGGSFVAASGQALATLPDIGPGASVTVSLSAVASLSATEGPNSIGLTMTYRDFEGETFTSTAALTVNVQKVDEASQVTLARYMANPNPALPGEAVTVTVLVTNSGNETASQVLLQMSTSADSILLAGPQGDSFPLGDIAPGGSASLDLPLIVGASAKDGPQPQAFTLTFLQDGESKEVKGSMTVEIAKTEVPAPVLLLESYDIGENVLKPGDQFKLTMNLQNVGTADATDLLITFGTVESSGSSGDNGNDNSGGPSTASTTPSTTFAPLGAGGTIYVGTLAADREIVTLEQDFIVNGSVTSGIYSLPITLRYKKPDGSAGQDSLRASVVVLAPPRLRIELQSPLPESANVGEPLPIALDIINVGRRDVDLTFANFEVENAEILDGAETFLGTLKTTEDTSVTATIMPNDEGTVKVKVIFNYLDELNQEQTIIEDYEIQALLPPPPPEDVGPIIPDFNNPPLEEEPDNSDFLGRLLLGLLGLGS